MFTIRISDRDGSHFSSTKFDDLQAAGLFAIRNCQGRENGAEVIEIANGKATRVAEFFEGKQVVSAPCEMPLFGKLADLVAIA